MAVELEQPWTFRPLTPLQAERVSQLARGGDVGVVSVPADRMEQYAINDSLMGKESMVPVVQGKEIAIGKRLPLWIVTDERFCDGFYFVSALKQLRILLADPSRMAERLENLAEDTKVIDKHSLRKK